MQLKSTAGMKPELKWLAVAVLLALTPMNAAAQRSETDLILSEYWAGTARELTEKGLRTEAIVAALKGIPEGTTDEEMHQFQTAHDALYAAMRSNNFALPVGDRTVHMRIRREPPVTPQATSASIRHMPDTYCGKAFRPGPL